MRKWTLPLAAAAGLAALSIGTLHAQQGGPPQLPGQMDPSRVTAGTPPKGFITDSRNEAAAQCNFVAARRSGVKART